ncbi:hypothetical protein OS493_021980 [Desmophyllum pertusum]|uniref:Prolyl 4-hydroxylase N-terminal domain-containing protein n=1 Tax=Desmophyllum pertusum TaxID=174260 RepID=A0A9W9ZBI3_9CNID|nr:hypothetical protein OS493_021980 [Desmophyllum pertusum]
MRFLLLAIFSLQQTYAEDFTPVRENVMALQSLEERLLPELEAFIVKKEDLLKELEKMINQTAASKELIRESSVEGYLGTPQNQYFLIKRFVDNWGTFEDLLNSDNSTNDLLTQIRNEQNAIPGQAELNKALRDLEKSSDIDPEGYRVLL